MASRLAVIGSLDHHGVEAALLYLEVLGVIATGRIGAEGLGTDQHASTVELDHATF